MKKTTYHLYLTEQEYSQVIYSLIDLKNTLLNRGKYTDVIDETVLKFSKAGKKRIKTIYK